jgi:hypothetical protein
MQQILLRLNQTREFEDPKQGHTGWHQVSETSGRWRLHDLKQPQPFFL